VDKILPLVAEVDSERNKRIPTAELNNLLRTATLNHAPAATKKGAHLRIYYATQPQVAPPVFLFFTNNKDLVHWSYGRYLENCIRERYSFLGTPIKVVFRSRDEKR
jgi:GTP-binding protein